MPTPFRALACLAALAVAAPALAGPDVTHQEIQDATRYGPVGSTYAYAWGSYTCNLGDAPLLWANGGTPALAMNAYRLFDGQILQIGIGHAKHACCVSNGAGCGTCQAGPGGTLRPGCRDIYSSGFNGGQGRLGPRSGINPYEGNFTSIPSQSGDAIFRRVQVTTAQMSPVTYPAARYFAEGVYVCNEEDATAQLNNATYRPMNVANAGTTPNYAWTPTGTSQFGKPAIFAWREHGLGLNTPDTSVQIVTADVPAEGRFFAAGKARELGGGLWRYDYAVFNLNSHVAASSFSIAIANGAMVTDIGFNDINYHSNEPYSPTDWTSARSGNRLTWSSPQTFAQNPNTNALRWGTMYNFWFTTDAAPTTGAATIGLFRPSSVTSIDTPAVPVLPSDHVLPVPTVPCVGCAADYNCAGGVSVQDVLDFLTDYFVAAPRADFNGVGGITVQDVFDFLSAYFAGCP